MQRPDNDAPSWSSPLQLFGDFGFVGGEDVAPNTQQNTQLCYNFYAEIDPQNAKEAIALLGCPGLVVKATAPGGGKTWDDPTQWPTPYTGPNLPVRGSWPRCAAHQASAAPGSYPTALRLKSSHSCSAGRLPCNDSRP